MARLPRPVTMMISDRPEATASSTTYWIIGLSTSGSISFGCALVAGRNRVPSPAAGNTALRMGAGEVTRRVLASASESTDYRPEALEQREGRHRRLVRTVTGPRLDLVAQVPQARVEAAGVERTVEAEPLGVV